MKKLKIILLISLFVILPACSHFHYVKSEINFTNLLGGGSHVITLFVDSSNVGDESLESVQSKILPVLESNKPISELEIESFIQNDTLYFTFTYDFANIDEFETKAEQITGKEYSFETSKSIDPFYNVVTFSGLSINEEDFSYWAVKAIEDAQLFSYSNLTGSTSQQGTTIIFNGAEKYSSNGQFDVVSIWPIQEIKIHTSINRERELTRHITISLDKNSLNLDRLEVVNNEDILRYFQMKLDTITLGEGITFSEGKQSSNDTSVIYEFNATGTNTEKLAEFTDTLLLGFSTSMNLSYDETSKLISYEEYFYSNDYGYEEALGSNAIIHTFEFRSYNLINVDDQAYDKNIEYNFELKDNMIETSGNTYNINVDLKYNPILEMILIGVGVMVVLLIGIFLWLNHKKKHPEKHVKKQKAMPNVKNIAKVLNVNEQSVDILMPDQTILNVSKENMYENPQQNDHVEVFKSDSEIVVTLLSPIPEPSLAPKKDLNYVITEMDELTITIKNSENTLVIQKIDAYDHPQIGDKVDYFHNDELQMITKK